MGNAKLGNCTENKGPCRNFRERRSMRERLYMQSATVILDSVQA